jgi:hypothetical protein
LWKKFLTGGVVKGVLTDALTAEVLFQDDGGHPAKDAPDGPEGEDCLWRVDEGHGKVGDFKF